MKSSMCERVCVCMCVSGGCEMCFSKYWEVGWWDCLISSSEKKRKDFWTSPCFFLRIIWMGFVMQKSLREKEYSFCVVKNFWEKNRFLQTRYVWWISKLCVQLLSIHYYWNVFVFKKLQYKPWPSKQPVQISVSRELRWEWVVLGILVNN